MNDIVAAADLPADWFTRGPSRGGERGLIAETGWLSTPLVAMTSAGACLPVFEQSEQESRAYLQRVLEAAESSDLDLITWWSDEDLVPAPFMTDCPCTFDATWCTVLDVFRGAAPTGSVDTQLFGEVLLKAFGTMGLRDYDGTPKPLADVWTAAAARPLSASR